MPGSIWTKTLTRALKEIETVVAVVKSTRPAASRPTNESAQRDCAAALDSVLSKIPTAWGRLVFLALLRDKHSGTDYQQVLSAIFGAETVTALLRQRHQQLFAQWLEWTLEEQRNDLLEYLLQENLDAEGLIQWIDATLRQNQIPDNVIDPARDLFLTDLRTVLLLLRSSG
jgi:hypothetical protein